MLDNFAHSASIEHLESRTEIKFSPNTNSRILLAARRTVESQERCHTVEEEDLRLPPKEALEDFCLCELSAVCRALSIIS